LARKRTTVELEPYGLGVPEAAHWAGTGETHIWALIKAGEIEAYRDGKRTRVVFASLKRRQANLPRVVEPEEAA
jgi:excisionase family DNA binding protein